ncbi:unnamed protein product [Ilex paraguariensis]|uniref:Uncharacterized protein n=1 Tax=Ilex paraguariensis TaxID=185542 RepID=A0ABC8ULX0_9AQUA
MLVPMKSSETINFNASHYSTHDTEWAKPQDGEIKINIDATVGRVRSCTGEVMAMTLAQVDTTESPMAEARVARQATKMNWSYATIEGYHSLSNTLTCQDPVVYPYNYSIH